MPRGSGADGAPAKLIGINTWRPSDAYDGPSAMPLSAALMQPVPFGLAARSHAPAAVDGAVGGNGSSPTVTGSGAGAGGLLRTSGTKGLAQSHCAPRSHVAIDFHELAAWKSSRPESWHFGAALDGAFSSSVRVVTPVLGVVLHAVPSECA